MNAKEITMQTIADAYNSEVINDVTFSEYEIKLVKTARLEDKATSIGCNRVVDYKGLDGCIYYNAEQGLKIVVKDDKAVVLPMSLRDLAKSKAIAICEDDDNVDRYNEWSHTGNTHVWLCAGKDGDVWETEEADMQTGHYYDYSHEPIANILDICSCDSGYCDCDACVSWRDLEDDNISDEEFERRWGCERDKKELEYGFASWLRDWDAYYSDYAQDAINNINDIEYGYFDDEDKPAEE